MSPDPNDFLKAQKSQSGRYITVSIGAAYLSGLLIIVQAWLLAVVIDGLIFQEQNIQEFKPVLGLLVLIFLVRFIFLSISDRTGFLGAQRVKAELRKALYDRLQKLGPIFITAQGSGALLNSLSEGIESIEGYYAQFLPSKTLMAILPLSVLAVVAPFDWVSGLVLLVTAPLIPLFMIIIGKGAESLNQKQWKKLARMSNHFLDVIQGMTTLKMFNAARREGEMISKISEEYRRDTMSVLRLAFLSSVTLEFFSTVAIAMVAVLIGFRLMWGDIEFFYGFFILLLAPEFYLPLRKMGAAYHSKMEAVGAVDKMIEVMNAPLPKAGAAKLPLLDKVEISFKEVCFSYDQELKAVEGISFDLNAGQKYALIGPSGSGKSTIFSLLLGFVSPQEGEVLISGQSLSDIDISTWRNQISWIPQSSTLFAGSVLDNIRLGKQGASDGEIMALCSELGIDEFISALPNGYQTLVGENGYGLSGGEIQRISIARAYLRDAPFILMDEPTASLDKHTEEVLQHAMASLSKNKTVLTIAHRLHTIRQADQILYMKGGRIIERGTHAQLYDSSADYARLIDNDLPYVANSEGGA